MKPVSARQSSVNIGAEVALVFTLAGGTLLAFRWPTPFGNISLSRGGAALVLALLVARQLTAGTSHVPRSLQPVLATAVVLLGVGTLGLARSPDLPVGIVLFGNLAEAILLLIGVFLLTRQLLQTGHSIARLAVLPLIAFFPAGLLGVYQGVQLYAGQVPSIPLIQFSGVDPAFHAGRTRFGTGLNELGLDRIAGATGDPPTYGILCALVVLYALWLRQTGVEIRRFLHLGVLVLGGLGVVMSASASALAVVAFGLFFLLVPARRRLPLLARFGIATVVLLLVATQISFVQGFTQSALGRVTPLLSGEGTLQGHQSLASAAWRAFLDHPIIGTGSGGLALRQYGYSVGFSSVHNMYLLQLAELGLVGGLALFAFLASIWRHLAPRWLFLACSVSWFVYLDVNRLPYVWALLGVAAAIDRHRTENDAASDWQQPVQALS